jgi:hypothetical protein
MNRLRRLSNLRVDLVEIQMNLVILINIVLFHTTYDHRLRRIGHPVRSAIHKPQIGRSVVGWVTTSESLLLYVFAIYFFLPVARQLWSEL